MSASTKAGHKGRVLVVDDEASSRSGLEKLLRQEGFDVDVASDGAAALRVAEAHPPDVVVTDVKMPGMDGVELLANLRRQDRALPVIMATAFDDVSSAVNAMRLGADDYLTKPVDVDLLVASIRRAIERRSDMGERFRELSMGMLAHDLRNPLNAVLGATQMLRLTASESQERSLERIVQSAGRIGRMIAQVLDFTRARSGGGIHLTRAPGDLHAICKQAAEELTSTHPERTIDVTKAGDTSGQWDLDRMAQVFSNLLANALAYGRTDTPVEVMLHATDGEIRCAVHNVGPAIPAELLPNLFDPFRRAPPHAEPTAMQGLGLGLFIVQQVVSAHGGTISVHSTEEDGTLFTFTLPRTTAARTMTAAPSQA